jgi:hypothetical protein
MKKILSFLIGWVWIVGGSLVPLKGVHWVEQNGHYRSPSGGQPESRHLYDWQEAKAELKFPELNEGEVVWDAHHPCRLLKKDVKDWLLRLGAVEPNGDRLKIRQKLSITCVVHQPCREESFATSERLWYRNDLPPGEAAILFIPLSPGRISFSIPADYSFDGLRRASLPNGFVKRMFPFGLRDAPDWFFTRISGADDHQPFAFASLVFCPRWKQVFVSLEIIPPARMVLNNIQAVENLLKHFTNPNHPCWQNRRVTIIGSEPAPQVSQPRQTDTQPSPSESPESDPGDFFEEPQERPFSEPRPNADTWPYDWKEPEGCPPQHETARHERWWRQRNEWHRQWEVWFTQQIQRWERRKQRWETRERRRCDAIRARQERVIRHMECSEQEALADFARPSGAVATEIETQWAPPPSNLPQFNEDILAEILGDVLTEDIELNGDALLEEILDDDDEEPPEPPEEPNIPPQPEPEIYLLPRPSLEPHLPPRPSDENHPPDPSNVIHHSLKSQMDEVMRLWNENTREDNQLRNILKPYISHQENLPSDRRCVCTVFEGEQNWVRISYNFSRAVFVSDLIRNSDRCDVLALQQQRLHHQARELWQRSFELYRQEGDRYQRWVQDYNRRVEEYNAAFEREKERINRQAEEFNAVLRSERERVEREQNRWREEVRQEAERYRREQQEYREKLRRLQEEQQRKQQQRLQEAGKVLESRATKLLERAQYQVYQASMFPLPSARPSRSGGRPRSNSPPPLNDTWIRRAEGAVGIGDHQNFIRTKVRRLLRDGCGLSQRTAQNWGDSVEYATDAAIAWFLGGLSKCGKAASFAGGVIKAAAKKAVGKVTRPLVPGEGRTGIHTNVRNQNRREGLSQVESNHLPPASFLRRHGVRPEDGVTMNTQQIHGTRDGRHFDFHQLPEVRNLTRPMDQTGGRDALSRCIRGMRETYQRDGVYTPDIRRGLQDVIRQNRREHPELFLRD